MLKFLRKKNIAKIIFWGLAILILPAFVLWGVGSVGRSKPKGPSYVGLIDNNKISFDELSKNIVSIRCQIILNYANQPKILDAFLKNRGFLAQLAWDRLLMLNEAKKYKIGVKDKDIIDLIKSHPLFSRNGKFDDKIYQYILRYNIGMDPRTFEEIMRENLRIQRLNDNLTKDIRVSDNETLEEYRREFEKFKLSYVLIAPSDSPDKGGGDEAQIKTKTPALERAEEIREKLLELIGKEGRTFEAAAAELNLKVIETRKGALIFRVLETQSFDKEKFEKEKGEYSKKVLERKKTEFLENWLKTLEKKATVNIKLGDYEKYQGNVS